MYMKANTREAVTPPTEAVILAAGRGSRLQSETDAVPKCLTEVGGRTLLEHQLELLYGAGIERICVVAGYQAQAVQDAVGDAAEIIYNDLWASTNSLYSLSLCRQWVHGPVIIKNCDVMVDAEAIRRLRANDGSAFLYDSLSGDDEEHMKVELHAGRLTAMSKDLQADRVCGENVGILQFASDAVRFLFREADAALRMLGRKHWQAVAVERLCEIVPVHGVDICDLPWIEIDYPEDLEMARRTVWPAIQERSRLPDGSRWAPHAAMNASA